MTSNNASANMSAGLRNGPLCSYSTQRNRGNTPGRARLIDPTANAQRTAIGDCSDLRFIGRFLHRSTIRAMHKNETGEKAPFDINELIRHSIGLLKRELQTRGVTIETELHAGLPPVIGNRIQLQQVLLNLMTNAIDAMSGITDRVRKLQLKSGMHEANAIMVSVLDSGTGITPNDADRIFQAAFTTKSKGLGMGLAICQSIVEAHSGRIWVEPGPVYGTVFGFVLPV